MYHQLNHFKKPTSQQTNPLEAAAKKRTQIQTNNNKQKQDKPHRASAWQKISKCYNNSINSNELLPLIENNTNKLIEQTKTRPQETPEFEKYKSYETFSFDSPFNLEGNWFLSLTSLEVCNLLFNINEANGKLSIFTPGHYNDPKTTEEKQIMPS